MASHEHLDALEVRFSTPGEDGEIEGVAVRFDVVDAYGTTFDRRAFASTSRLPMLWSHSPADVIGSWSSVAADDTGLRVRGRLNMEVTRAREVRAMLLAGDVRGLSVGFSTLKSESRPGGIRHVTKAQLHEISLVAMPAVPGSRVTKIRSDDRAGAAARLAEAARSAARAIKQRI